MCLGSQNGDIAIYYLDNRDSKGNLCQSLIEQFNFIERGPSKQALNEKEKEKEKEKETVKEHEYDIEELQQQL